MIFSSEWSRPVAPLRLDLVPKTGTSALRDFTNELDVGWLLAFSSYIVLGCNLVKSGGYSVIIPEV